MVGARTSTKTKKEETFVPRSQTNKQTKPDASQEIIRRVSRAGRLRIVGNASVTHVGRTSERGVAQCGFGLGPQPQALLVVVLAAVVHGALLSLVRAGFVAYETRRFLVRQAMSALEVLLVLRVFGTGDRRRFRPLGFRLLGFLRCVLGLGEGYAIGGHVLNYLLFGNSRFLKLKINVEIGVKKDF